MEVAVIDLEKVEDNAKIAPKGELQSIATRVIMRVLYAARMARYDLLHACHKLATRVTK